MGITLQRNLIPDDLEITTHTVPNNDIVEHKHTHFEIFYILNGSTQHTLNGEVKKLTQGDCVLLTPNDVHSFKKTGQSLQRDILVSCSLFEQVCKLISHNDDYATELFGKTTSIPQFTLPELLELEILANKFTYCIDVVKKRGIGIELLTKIINKFINTDNNLGSNTPPPLISQIIALLNKSHALKGGIPVIVKDIKYSKSYICYFFKKNMGVTLSQYIKEMRLKYIKYYLTVTNYSLREIADNVGIESLSYLNKIFKEKHKISPIKFRKNFNYAQAEEDLRL